MDNRIHSLELTARRKGSITGVEKVVSSNDTAITLVTSAGNLAILGTGLKINRFNIDEGSLSYEGEVHTIKYAAKKQPLVKRLFK